MKIEHALFPWDKLRLMIRHRILFQMLKESFFTWIGLMCWRVVISPHKINSIKVVVVEITEWNKKIYHERWIRPSNKI